jgi:hypothetical protein
MIPRFASVIARLFFLYIGLVGLEATISPYLSPRRFCRQSSMIGGSVVLYLPIFLPSQFLLLPNGAVLNCSFVAILCYFLRAAMLRLRICFCLDGISFNSLMLIRQLLVE